MLAGRPAIHINPWQALEAWGQSIPYLFSEKGLKEIRMALPDARAAEIRALKKLGCRRIERGMDSTGAGWVWVCRKDDFRAGGRYAGVTYCSSSADTKVEYFIMGRGV
jgi:hypothetical protein